jgi:hypothetical protein
MATDTYAAVQTALAASKLTPISLTGSACGARHIFGACKNR